MRSALCCHNNKTRAPIANRANSSQLEGAPYHSPKLHSGPCSSVGMRRGTDRHTDRRSLLIYISLRLRLPHAKCNYGKRPNIVNSAKRDHNAFTLSHTHAHTHARVQLICGDVIECLIHYPLVHFDCWRWHRDVLRLLGLQRRHSAGSHSDISCCAL